MAALAQFIEPVNPLIYYRVIPGHWGYLGEAIDNGQFTNIYLEDPKSGTAVDYLHYYSPTSVFATVFKNLFPYPTEDAHLFFNTLARGHFLHAQRGIEDITIVKVTTNVPLPLVEDYVSTMSWTNPSTGDRIIGAPKDSMRLQGVTGREYVLVMNALVDIRLAHYRSTDGIVFTSPHAAPFAATEDCIVETAPYLPSIEALPVNATNVMRRSYMGTTVEQQRNPENFEVVDVIQGLYPRVLWSRIRQDRTCVPPFGAY